MKAIAVFLLFVGMFLVVQGYYSQENKKCEEPKVVVKYIPRSLYEEQLSNDPEKSLSRQFKGMFEDANPWNPKRG